MLWHADSSQFLKTLESESFDACVTDPYFGVMSLGNSRAAKKDRADGFPVVAAEVFRLLKQDSPFVFFCALPYMLANFALLTGMGFAFKYELVWNKNRGISFLTAKKRPLQKHETVWVFSKGKCPYHWEQARQHGFPPTSRGVYDIDRDYVRVKTTPHANDGSRYMTTVIDCPVSTYRKRTSHPHEKPLPLCERLLAAYTKPGDLVLDPYAGSGNIGVAAEAGGRRYVGVERDAKYFQEAQANLEHQPPHRARSHLDE